MADLVQKIMKTAISVSGSSTRTLPALPSPAGSAGTSDRSSGQSPKQLVVCRQWWKVCWVYGDQYKQGQKLYQAQKRILAKASTSNGNVNDKNVNSEANRMLPAGASDAVNVVSVETDSGNDSAGTTQLTPTKGPRRPCALPRDRIAE